MTNFGIRGNACEGMLQRVKDPNGGVYVVFGNELSDLVDVRLRLARKAVHAAHARFFERARSRVRVAAIARGPSAT